MQCKIEAIPTEWRGVRYRSKCEAMFAVWLYNDLINLNRDLQNDGQSRFQVGFDFQYEPQSLVTWKWVPDFFVAKVFLDFCKQEVFPKASCVYEVIEYKPSEPTQTYIDNFEKHCSYLHQKFFSGKHVTYSLYYGSPYRCMESGKVYWDSVLHEDGWKTESGWLDNEFAEALLNHRFDLK